MTLHALMLLCWIAFWLTAIVLVGGAALGAAYSHDSGVNNLVMATAQAAGIGVVLFALPRGRGGLHIVLQLAAALIAVALIGVFGLRLYMDAGDAVLWTPPVVLGLGLIAVVLGVGRPSETRGDP